MLGEGAKLDFGRANFFRKPGLSLLDTSREGRGLLSDHGTLS